MTRERRMGRRGVVRLVSFAVAIIAALAISSLISYTAAKRYQTTIEYSYQRSLSDLTEYINNLEISLTKGQYATTEKQVQGLAMKLQQDANFAKNALGILPMKSEELIATNKFLSQVGNYCQALSRRVSIGGKITADEQANLDKLSEYAKKLSVRIKTLADELESGTMSIHELSGKAKKVEKGVKAAAGNADKSSEATDAGGFQEIEESFADYPTMIYDGPFSDHVLQQKPKFVKGKSNVSKEEALRVAAEATGQKSLSYSGETGGNLATYNFTYDSLRVSVTKAGGVLESFLDSRRIGERTISTDEAVKLAEHAMRKMGYSEFSYRYYAFNNGVLTVNFAIMENNLVIYPDLVKIGIALDNGKVVSYDAKGYIMNHTTRTFDSPKITEAQARKVLSTKLKPTDGGNLVLVPSEGLREVLCWEFLCKGIEDEDVLVYIDCETGMEEQILIIIKDDNGILSM